MTYDRLAAFFLDAQDPVQRRYEALRAFFAEGHPSAEVAAQFGYSPGTFRNLCSEFRRNPRQVFFVSPRTAPRPTPERDRVRELIVALRKQNMSIYEISEALQKEKNVKRSPAAVGNVLKKAGFARLPRRADEERASTTRPDIAPVADVRQIDWTPRQFRTQFGGLFLFLPYLARFPFDQMMRQSGLPGTKMIPAGHAMRSLLGLKLFGKARHSHVMSYVFDQGLALFAGLNEIPKRALLTEYSTRISPRCFPNMMRRWFDAMATLELKRGVSFDLDFHTIPFHGEDALVEKHYVAKRSRRQKGVLAFLARDADTTVFCYANADIRKADQADEVIRFAKYWKQRTKKWPEELVFDSRLTTYSRLDWLNKKDIAFITLRRRGKRLLEELEQMPASAWRRVELENVSRAYRTPRILDRRIEVDGYTGPLRQIAITELGHEEPTLLITNQLKRSARKLIGRYACRMVIENKIADGIDFFHMDALSSAVAMNVNLDLQLTLMADSLYRMFGSEIGKGYEVATSRHIFRDFVDATASVSISEREVAVRFSKRAHNPYLLAAGFDKLVVPVSWWGRRRLRLIFG